MSRVVTLVACALLAGSPPPVERVLPNDNQTAAGAYVGDTLVLRLVATRGAWPIHGNADEPIDVLAFAEDGQAPTVPGPLLRASEGTPVRVTVRNPLTDTLIVHGLGPRGDGQPDSVVVAPGGAATVRFATGRPGSYLYWAAIPGPMATMGRRRGAASQLTGAYVVDPRGRPLKDRVLVITAIADTLRPDGSYLTDSRGLVLREFVAVNGRSWPNTERFTHAVGDSVQWRVLNGSPAPHAMHLHGFYFGVEAKGDDGADTDTAYATGGRRMAVTELLMQGQTMSMVWSAARPGRWLFHCHMTMHAVREPPIGRRDALAYPSGHTHDPDRHA